MQLLSTAVKLRPVFIAPLLLLIICAPHLFGEDAASAGTAKSLAAAERAFAQESVEKGTRAAFLNALSEDGIVFLPGPQNGRKAWQAKPQSESVLQWQPVLAAIATQGDLGYTTGPWTFKKQPSDSVPVAFGQFVSIWRWENGKWKLLFDLGSDNPAPTEPRPDLQLVENHAPNQSATDAEPVMLNHDHRYAADRAGTLAASAEENIRLYQPDKFPIIGKAAAAAALRQDASAMKFGEPKAGLSKGGDLGYAWGEYFAGSTTKPTGDYLRIWRKDRAGEWKLALDLVHPR